jgi:hypothetical protein
MRVRRADLGREWWVRAYRLIFGLLGFAAMGYQLDKSPNAVNFFSFFTIQSNIIGAVVLLLGAIYLFDWVRNPTLAWSLVRGAAAIYLALTGVVYNTLLTDVDVQTSDAWVNDVVHKIIPIVMIFDFVVVPLAHRITFRQALVWTIYPIAYLAYSLIRGPIADWYPYPFLDPREDGGYDRVAMYCVAILVGFIAVTWVMVKVNDWRTTDKG